MKRNIVQMTSQKHLSIHHFWYISHLYLITSSPFTWNTGFPRIDRRSNNTGGLIPSDEAVLVNEGSEEATRNVRYAEAEKRKRIWIVSMCAQIALTRRTRIGAEWANNPQTNSQQSPKSSGNNPQTKSGSHWDKNYSTWEEFKKTLLIENTKTTKL